MDSTVDTSPRRSHNQALGAYGELLAARFLTGQGLVLLDQNWRSSEGEVDLVLRDGRTLVICEVKTRTSNDYGTPHEAIDRRKVDRMRRLAGSWLRVHSVHPDGIRLDLVAVIVPREGDPEIDHVIGLS
ncbi:MAG: Endonuclease [uncultured Nocardioides sp.]|uniref:UPF0102 protein AVDCRST_MAG60-750 n=1 Tax=uncultured Nocardioides sp. TaxID=198441 RepID=A0A6J4N6K9_9ACTN|nr:MAG: Endonuclease [uncultured Nocardioides sp.]